MDYKPSERWTALDGNRSSLLARCQDYARFTIPALLPDRNESRDGVYRTPSFNSLGAQLVNNLANKLMLSLFAPSRNFFRFQVSQQKRDEAAKNGVTASQLDTILANYEREALHEFESMHMRGKLFECLQHLIVTGNYLLVFYKDSYEVYSMNDYCQRIGADDKIVELVIRTSVHALELEPDDYKMLDEAEREGYVDIYRYVRRTAQDKWVVTHAINDHVKAKKFEYNSKTLPYFPQFWFRPSKANYGVGLVEQYFSDFNTINTLTKAELDLAQLAACFRLVVNPNTESAAFVEDLKTSSNGDVIPGNNEDLSILMATRNVDINSIAGVLQETVNRLSQAFLLSNTQQITRDRVTAQEIRTIVNELETSLGGVHTRLADGIQKPLADKICKALKLTDSDLNDLRPTIITGLDALSRSGDLDSLRQFLQDAGVLSQVDQVYGQYLNAIGILRSMASGNGIDLAMAVKTDEQIQQEQQQQAEQQQQEQLQQAMLQAATEGASAPQQGQQEE